MTEHIYTLIYRAGSGEVRGAYVQASTLAQAQKEAREWAALHGGVVILLRRGVRVIPPGVQVDGAGR